jgi:hypothetical protein
MKITFSPIEEDLKLDLDRGFDGDTEDTLGIKFYSSIKLEHEGGIVVITASLLDFAINFVWGCAQVMADDESSVAFREFYGTSEVIISKVDNRLRLTTDEGEALTCNGLEFLLAAVEFCSKVSAYIEDVSKIKSSDLKHLVQVKEAVIEMAKRLS